jgi:hypothetical protein
LNIKLYNPHIDDFFFEPLVYRLFRRRALRKYGFLLNEIEGITVYIDYTESGIIPFSYFKVLPYLFRRLIVDLEIILWRSINKNVQISKAIDNEDVLLVMSYKTGHNMPEERLKTFSKFRKVIMHLSHYFVNTQIKSTNLSKVKDVILAGDSDLTDNGYFKHYFRWYDKKVLVLPFALSERWSNVEVVEWQLRKKCIATGTVHDLTKERPRKYYRSYIDFSGLTTYHPRRVEADLYMKENNLTSFVSYYRGKNRNFVQGIFKKFLISQKAYFSINLVKEYSSHKFAVVGEEYTGFPPLGVIEAMSCGCIPIVDISKFDGLNLKDGFNCIAQSGDYDDLFTRLEGVPDDDLAKMSVRARESAIAFWGARNMACFWKEQILANLL